MKESVFELLDLKIWIVFKLPKYTDILFQLRPSAELLQILRHDVVKVLHSVQFSSVTQLCPTLCDPMNRSTPGLPVHQQLLEFTQTHFH